MAGLAAVRVLGRRRSWRQWAVSAVLGRLLATMVVLSYVLVGEAVYGSLALGALLAGAATFSAGLAAPVLGRMLDRWGIKRGLVVSLAVTAVLLAVQSLLVGLAAPPWMLFGVAVAHGVAYAPVPGGYRALLVPAVDAQHLPRANTIDAVLTEVGFIAGPAVAGAVAALSGSVWTVVTMAAVVAVAAATTARLPGEVRGSPAATRPWATSPARVVYAVALAMGVMIGIFESVLAARVVDVGRDASLAGPLLALVAVGSGLGGLAVSTLEDQRGRRLVRAAGALAVLGSALVLVSWADDVVTLAVTVFVVGIPIAPLNAIGSQLLQDTLDPGQLAEGFAVYTALILIGVGLGDLFTGGLLDAVGSAWLVSAAAVVPMLVLVSFLPVVVQRRLTGQRS